jgi:hypothetical protein
MLTRQPVCETEIVPSLHSNLGVGSTACGGIDAAAACCGAGACATGFGGKAQPAHESRIDKAKPVRIRVASGKPFQQPIGSTSSRANRQPRVHATTAQRDSNITGRCISRQLDGPCDSTNGNKTCSNAGPEAALACVRWTMAHEDREARGLRGWNAEGDQQAAYQPSGNGIKPQAVWLSLAARSSSCCSNNFGEVTTKSSGEGATAVRTASSNRSNSTSLIALSQILERSVAKVFCFQIEAIAQIVSIERSCPCLVIDFLTRGATSSRPASHQM